VCPRCSASYPVENEIADFGKGEYVDAFEGEESLDDNQRAGLRGEVEGSVHRVDEYFLPRMRAALPPPETCWRVLDCGCGNGVVVDSLNSRGIETWGVDLSALRKWQWRERVFRRRLATAGATRLPFADAVFDVVLASGLLEHLGVEESRSPDYRVRPSANRDDVRRKFVSEVARVLKPDGIAWLDFPNGAFPIDFWHTTRIFRPGGIRRVRSFCRGSGRSADTPRSWTAA
jgi:SAM-dependent methyltransferase